MKVLKLVHKLSGECHCSAVVLSAGSSERMGRDKMLIDLGGVPVLARSLAAFQNCPEVDEIIVVTRGSMLEETAQLCRRHGMTKVKKIVIGGKTRTESALAGVSEVSRCADFIAVHDGARPFVTVELVERTLDAARKFRAAAPAVKSVDTLKKVDENGYIEENVDRECTVRIQTPQIFDADIIKGALTYAMKDGTVFTDDCAAVGAIGYKTRIVDGDEENIKITTENDITIAEAILKNRSRRI